MSGHSKWSKIKRKKGAEDAKRGKIFSKLSKLITVAARDGGGDPDMNPSLRMAIDNAKAENMPNDNIERAIKKGTGELEGGRIEEVIYEAIGGGGAAFLIECLTDNKNRAIAEIKTVLNKTSFSMADNGSVSYQFNRAGEVVVDTEKSGKEKSDIEEAILLSGANDMEEDEGLYFIYTDYDKLNNVAEHLESEGIKPKSSELVYLCKNPLSVSDEVVDSTEKALDMLDDLDDVNRVYTNIDI